MSGVTPAWTIAWLAWLGPILLGWELVAVARHRPQDTLSWHMWRWFSVVEHRRFWVLRRAILSAFFAAFYLHICWAWTVVPLVVAAVPFALTIGLSVAFERHLNGDLEHQIRRRAAGLLSDRAASELDGRNRRFWSSDRFYALAFFLLASPVSAQEQFKALAELAPYYLGTDAPTFLGGYVWKQALFEGATQADGSFSTIRGDIWGGRIVGGLGLGRFGLELRVDASGLKDQFDAQDPRTYQSIESYAMAHFVAAAPGGVLQIGPAAMVGGISSFKADAPWRGFGADVVGVGARIAARGSELEVFIARTSFLANDPSLRLVAVAHVRLTDQMAAVADVVSGSDGFIRCGIAVRAF